MIAPFSKKRFDLKEKITSSNSIVHYTLPNDDGKENSFNRALH